MAEDEESQVAEDFGRMVRIATGSIMQVAESRARRRQVGASTDAAELRDWRRMEDNAARVVQHDLYRAEFWKHAGSESIADRMAVAATLGESHPAAQSAWMHGADVIRSTYGIDLQKINRDHPTSQEERHAALRDALDDRLQMNRYDAAAAKTHQEREPEFWYSYGQNEHGPEVFKALTEAEAVEYIRNLPDGPAKSRDEDHVHNVRGMLGKSSEVDQAAYDKWPDEVEREHKSRLEMPTHGRPAFELPSRSAAREAETAQGAEMLEAEADRERMEEGESLERAERAEDAGRDVQPTLDTDGLAARREFARERAEEATATPQGPGPSPVATAAHERVAGTGRVNLGQLEQTTSPQMVQSRVRQLQSFALDPTKALAATKQHGRRGAHGQGAEQGRQEVLSR